MNEVFSVYQDFPDGRYECVLLFADAETAMRQAFALIRSVGGLVGTTQRVYIVDGGDSIVFEWEYGKGIVWPEELVGRPV
jgi:hypothetical protein